MDRVLSREGNSLRDIVIKKLEPGDRILFKQDDQYAMMLRVHSNEIIISANGIGTKLVIQKCSDHRLGIGVALREKKTKDKDTNTGDDQ